MSDEKLKKIFQEAAEIAGSVPKELREAAFNRALDALLGTAPPKPGETQGISSKSRKKKDDGGSKDPVTILLAKLNRTSHPDILTAPRVFERALFLLRASRDDYKIDGLGAPQIAKILTDKFRLRTTRQAVRQVLDAAGDMVDRAIVSGKVYYRLMHPGDKYLDSGDFKSTKQSKKPIKKKFKKRKTAQNKSSGKTKAGKKPSKIGRPGPGEMLKQLVDSGFFAKQRSITDIQQHCEKKLAHKYALTDLSTPLRRAVHNGLLKRDKNDEGQYEYIVK